MNERDDLDSIGRRSGQRRLLIAGAFLAVAIAAATLLPLDTWLARFDGWIDAHPLGGRALFLAAVVLLSVLMVPGSLLMMAGGFLFGLLPALPLVSTGIGLGSGAAGLATRTLGRDLLASRYAQDRRFVAIDRAVADRGFLIVTLSRLSLLMPFNLLNVIYGLSRIPLWKLTLGTWIGMTPSVVLYTYLGSITSDVDTLVAGDVDGFARRAIIVSGLVVVAVVTWLVHRIATRALQQELGDDGLPQAK